MLQISPKGSDSLDDTERRAWFSQVIWPTEKGDVNTQFLPMTIEEAERANASRALQLALWVTVSFCQLRGYLTTLVPSRCCCHILLDYFRGLR
jgi:hypothetical protein